ncbi:DUF106 domain-containing protein [Natrinema caseinilyticum]|uniref:DUF106 domain-containing protein n=1 Tax=Natrinema caseinilyticum TaxID=2961570 RepID=UPI0020C2BCA8|nr:EMC3/TMCO1 family protein [Natrinema caseinilyticum]
MSAIQDAVATVLDVAFGPAVAVLPFPAVVVVLAVTTTIAATVVRHRTDPPEMDGLRHRNHELTERLTAARASGDDETADRIADRRRELVTGQALLMTGHLKVLARTMLVTVPVFLYLSWLVVAPVHAAMPLVTVAPVLGDVVWTARIIGPVRAWMAWYALCSIASNLVVRHAVPDRIWTAS